MKIPINEKTLFRIKYRLEAINFNVYISIM